MAKVTFRKERCKSCGQCILACPKNIINFENFLNEKGYNPAGISDDNKEKCIGCACCAKMCPDLVITVEK